MDMGTNNQIVNGIVTVATLVPEMLVYNRFVTMELPTIHIAIFVLHEHSCTTINVCTKPTTGIHLAIPHVV